MTASFLVTAILGILIAFIVHEWAHAKAAYSLGDPTSKYDGRLTLNPAVHLDFVGTIVLTSSMIMSHGGLCYGWAKPVMFNRDNFKNPWGDGALVALAGPLANLFTAMFFATLCRFGLPGTYVFTIFVSANVCFGLFNLFPLPPLDGSKILQAFVPRALAEPMKTFAERLGRFAPVFLLLCSLGFVPIFVAPAVGYTLYFLMVFPN